MVSDVVEREAMEPETVERVTPGALARFFSRESWREHRCDCGAVEVVPIAPADGLCSACREARAAARRPGTVALLASAGAPEAYRLLTRASWEAAFGPWSESPALAKLDGWVETVGEWIAARRGGASPEPLRTWAVLAFGAAYGQRKTGLLTSAFGMLLDRGAVGIWISQEDWLRRIQEGFNPRPGVAASEDVFRRAAGAEVLLVDDLGSAGTADRPWSRSKLAELLRHREARRLPTLITANSAKWTGAGAIHQSLLSRLDGAGALRIPFTDGADFRREDG